MTARYLVADVFDGLASLETGSVDLIISSPPFLALRSYLPADHPDKGKEIGSEATPAEFIDVMLKVTAELRRVLAPHGSICIELGDTYAGSGGGGGDYLPGGWREGQQQFAGSEASMRESNAAHWRQKNQKKGGLARYNDARGNPDGMRDPTFSGANTLTGAGAGWPLAKSRTLIPQLYEIALAYGINPLTGTSSPAGQWRIRNVVTWARPNPPVGALGDKWRPATSDLIVACTSPKRYWDDLATRRPYQHPNHGQIGKDPRGSKGLPSDDDLSGRRIAIRAEHPSGAPLLDYWEIPLLEGEEPKQYGPAGKQSSTEKTVEYNARKGPTPGTKGPNLDRGDLGAGNFGAHPSGTPLLDYWEIPPGGYKGSHYAVFPEELVVPCIKAMCPEKVCRVCGEPSRRIVEHERTVDSDSTDWADNANVGGSRIKSSHGGLAVHVTRETLGWTDCGHDDWRPGLVLDPFAGSGTTLSVATGHGHDAIGIDLDPRNADLARDRIGPFLFEQVTV